MDEVGAPLAGWTPPPRPLRAPLPGRWMRLEPLDPERHAEALHAANAQDDRIWTWLPYGPFDGVAGYRSWAEAAAARDDPLFFAIATPEAGPLGVASFMRIQPEAGSIEIGHICFSPPLQRSCAGTEALTLMAREAFRLGYRRLEWKCDARNGPSRRLAERLGFSFEGVHRQAAVVKGRNRDTAWWSMLDGEAPTRLAAYDRWLDPANFDAEGRQRASLSELTRHLPVWRG
jgi:RimJ/RimL family protein N-acetyltransferase